MVESIENNRRYYALQSVKTPGQKTQYRLKIPFQLEGFHLILSALSKIGDYDDRTPLRKGMVQSAVCFRGETEERIHTTKEEICKEDLSDGSGRIYARILEGQTSGELILTTYRRAYLEQFVQPLIEVTKAYLITPENKNLLSEI
ncbi:MAG: hypothetical protein ABIG34_04975 [Candidatus Peregrinibacteria bacterium]